MEQLGVEVVDLIEDTCRSSASCHWITALHLTAALRPVVMMPPGGVVGQPSLFTVSGLHSPAALTSTFHRKHLCRKTAANHLASIRVNHSVSMVRLAAPPRGATALQIRSGSIFERDRVNPADQSVPNRKLNTFMDGTLLNVVVESTSRQLISIFQL